MSALNDEGRGKRHPLHQNHDNDDDDDGGGGGGGGTDVRDHAAAVVDHTEWSTLKPGPILGGLEMERDEEEDGRGEEEGKTAATTTTTTTTATALVAAIENVYRDDDNHPHALLMDRTGGGRGSDGVGRVASRPLESLSSESDSESNSQHVANDDDNDDEYDDDDDDDSGGEFPSFWAPNPDNEKATQATKVAWPKGRDARAGCRAMRGRGVGVGVGVPSSSRSSAIPNSFWDNDDDHHDELVNGTDKGRSRRNYGRPIRSGTGNGNRNAALPKCAPNLMDEAAMEKEDRSTSEGARGDGGFGRRSRNGNSSNVGGKSMSRDISEPGGPRLRSAPGAMHPFSFPTHTPPTSPPPPAYPLRNSRLSLAYALVVAAAAVPIALVPTMANDLLLAALDRLSDGDGDGKSRVVLEYDDDENFASALAAEASSFASRAAAWAVLGTAVGKFACGPAGDMFGARRVSSAFAACLSASLAALSFVRTLDGAALACALVEFFVSVQWPCVVVVLAAHHRGNGGGGGGGTGSGATGEGSGAGTHPSSSSSSSSCFGLAAGPVGGLIGVGSGGVWVDVERHGVGTARASLGVGDGGGMGGEGRYEAGVYVASLSSKAGSLLSMTLSSLTLRYTSWGWRSVARCGALSAALGCAALRAFVTDSPRAVHEPQNPVRPGTIASVPPARRNRQVWIEEPRRAACVVRAVLAANVLPSLRSILTSGTFWIVAVAHAGGATVRSSDRILGTYLSDTSRGTITARQAGGFTVFLSLGIFVGLAVGGSAFTRLAPHPRLRKDMVVKLYVLAVSMCYALSFLAMPMVRDFFVRSPGIVTTLQILAAFGMGAGIAVQHYIIPPIVGATFGTDKGLFAAYTDGVSNGVGAFVWRIVGGAVEEGDPQGGGWAYGWAAVALLVVLCGVLMVEFTEHYFCRGGWRVRAQKQVSFDSAALKGDDMPFDDNCGSSGNRAFLSNGFIRSPFSPKTATDSVRRRLQPFSTNSGSPIFFFDGIKATNDKRPHEEWLDDDGDEESTVIFDPVSARIDFSHDLNSRVNNDKKKPRTPEEALKDRVLQLLERPENEECADCTEKFPRWAIIIVPPNKDRNRTILTPSFGSMTEMGCFCCAACAGAHRGLGTQTVRVRSVDHDRWTAPSEVLALERGGNLVVNALLEATLSGGRLMKPSPASEGRSRQDFVRAKYEERRWCQVGGAKAAAAVVNLDEIRSLNSGVLADLSSDEEDMTNDGSLSDSLSKTIELVPSTPPVVQCELNGVEAKLREAQAPYIPIGTKEAVIAESTERVGEILTYDQEKSLEVTDSEGTVLSRYSTPASLAFDYSLSSCAQFSDIRSESETIETDLLGLTLPLQTVSTQDNEGYRNSVQSTERHNPFANNDIFDL